MILRTTLEQVGATNYDDIVLAGLGHDLYEDTKVTRSEVTETFGEVVDSLIFCLTNEKGDHDRADYMHKIAHSPESAVLIKLADMTENMQSVLYNIDSLGVDWLEDFFMPIMDDSVYVVRAYQFKEYADAAAHLKNAIAICYEQLKYVQAEGRAW